MPILYRLIYIVKTRCKSMATRKYRLNRKNSSGSYDVIHYETSSNIVLRPDGSSVEESLSNNNLPSGIIAMWSGASDAIPSGWLLCNGENNTPDLRNRFIVGAGSSYSVGNTGGSDSVTITTEQLPSHNHDHTFSINMSGLSCSSSGSHTHTLSLRRKASSVGGYPSIEYSSCDPPSYTPEQIRNASISSTGAHTHSITGSGTLSGSISNTGSGQSHENRPPYYALCFIMKQ